MSAHDHTPESIAEIADALSARAEDVCRRYLPRGCKQGRYWTAGDVSGAPGRSFFVRLSPPGVPGKWTDAATDEHGDLLDLIQISLRATTLGPALIEARNFLALAPATAAGRRTPDLNRPRDRSDSARQIWRACEPIKGTHAEAYLHSRGLMHCLFPALRFHPALRYRDPAGEQRLPALVAAVTTNAGEITGIHRTWLDPHRPAKASVANPRKALGGLHGFAVRFAPGAASRPLVVGEGIETVLSIVAAFPYLPAAAALSAAHLRAFTPPPGISRLVIAADADPEGEGAAAELAKRTDTLGIATNVVAPKHGDFNDELAALGTDALTCRLRPLLGHID